MDQQLAGFLRGRFLEASEVVVEALEPTPGGFSRETWRFDARLRHADGTEQVLPLILRKDPPRAAALLETSRMVEHHLVEAVRAHTSVPVSESFGYELDPDVFGEPAMIIQRMHGSGQTSNLFHDGPHTDQVDDVVRHLCEVISELHLTDTSRLDPTATWPTRAGRASTSPRGTRTWTRRTSTTSAPTTRSPSTRR